MSDLLSRAFTGLIIVALVLVFVYIGGIPLKIALLLMSFEMIHELYQAFKHKGYNLNLWMLIASSILIFLSVVFDVVMNFSVTFILAMFFLEFLYNDNFSIEELSASIFIVIYIPYILFQMIHLEGTAFIYLIFIISFSTDTFAYLFGVTFGKHKLIPKISPKKSVEGSIGGTLGCILVSAAYLYILDFNIQPFTILILLIASIFGQLGDLVASKIKRAVGIKDYGTVLPGHGGFLDRFDSTMLIIPLVYMLYYFVY